MAAQHREPPEPPPGRMQRSAVSSFGLPALRPAYSPLGDESVSVSRWRQFAGRVGLLLHVDDFDATIRPMLDCGVEFFTALRNEPNGSGAVFVGVAGGRASTCRRPFHGPAWLRCEVNAEAGLGQVEIDRLAASRRAH